MMRLYNTLTRELEAIEPIAPPRLTFYTCGPTVYDFAHIGNFRSFLAADVLRRYLDFIGFEVEHVMNMTDVGHMVDDSVADGVGEDKMAEAQRRIAEAKKAGTLPAGVENIDPSDPMAVANYYAEAFLRDGRLLGLKVAIEAESRPELMPRPTQYVAAMINMVQTLIDRGHAYVAADGVVYFDVQSWPEYGKLSGNTIESIRSGAGGRVDQNTQAVKKHPADFMLWKPDPTHLMRWPSPWGEGYPGWHLECSVMAQHLLGQETNGVIDLHSGGEDNIFPHHECERAQSCGATGEQQFARYWFHPRHLFVEGAKMSKSKGNFHTVAELIARGHTPAALRLELIKTHYRSNANFTFQGLKDSARMAERWRSFIAKGASESVGNGTRPADPNGERALRIEQAERDFRSAMENDLNIAGAIGVINRFIGDTGQPNTDDAALLRRLDAVLGVVEAAEAWEALPAATRANLMSATATAAGAGSETSGDAEGAIDVERIEALLVERTEARKARNFARADEIRDELAALGIEIKDSPTGPTWSKRAD
ncbi:MAG: cysteine--tRNA ligase [Planctomycetota bacterium]